MSDERIRQIVQQGINNQQITILQPNPNPQVFAGGTIFCPNSDFAWSQLAATTSGILPGTAGATNLEVYRVTRQIVGANIGAQRLRTVEADAWIPIWERVQGVAEIGAVSGADNYDIAFQLNNNWFVSNKKWFVRVAVATADTTPLPVGSRLFVGFWVVRTASQGWVESDNFDLEHTILGIPGTREFNYKVIAKTDTGVELESQVLNVTNIPDVFDLNTYVRITYAAAAGFTEFILYREDVATGEVRQIARDRNSAQLVAYDSGQEGTVVSGFPSSTIDRFRAYAEVPIDAVSIDLGKTFHNLALRIPASFDTSDVVSSYIRIGMVGPTDVNRQVYLDTVWASESYNVWSPSPFDDYPSPPSTSMTSGPPIGGGSTGNPPGTGGGSSCVWIGHDLLLPDNSGYDWEEVGNLKIGDMVDSGVGSNCIDDFIDGEVTQVMKLLFDCGLAIYATLSHRFIRSFEGHSGVLVDSLRVGDVLQGGKNRLPRKMVITEMELLNLQGSLKVRALKFAQTASNKFYAVGDRDTGFYVYSHNAKSAE